jgi:hypothetical protein
LNGGIGIASEEPTATVQVIIPVNTEPTNTPEQPTVTETPVEEPTETEAPKPAVNAIGGAERGFYCQQRYLVDEYGRFESGAAYY